MIPSRSPRELQALAAAGPADLTGVCQALSDALAGIGPALLPLPGDHASLNRITTALRPGRDGEPVAADIAAVVATSGSTGTPKGVLLTAAALRASAAATHDRLGGCGQWTLALPVSSIAGLQVLVRSDLAGTTATVVDSTKGFAASAFAGATAQLSASRRYTALVPTQLVRLLESPDGCEALRAYDAVLLGGAATSPSLLTRARGAGVRVVTTYGMTETCGGCVYDGVPLRDVGVRIGDDGRIALRGPMLFSGYRLQPDLTDEVLRDGEYLTSDLGRSGDEGKLEVIGRIDDIVITGGVNVALSAVEAAAGACPGIREAAVTSVPDAEWGARIVAVVTTHTPRNAVALQHEVRMHVAQQLGATAAPRSTIVVEKIPRLESGKVDRLAVRQLAAASGDDNAIDMEP